MTEHVYMLLEQHWHSLPAKDLLQPGQPLYAGPWPSCSPSSISLKGGVLLRLKRQ